MSPPRRSQAARSGDDRNAAAVGTSRSPPARGRLSLREAEHGSRVTDGASGRTCRSRRMTDRARDDHVARLLQQTANARARCPRGCRRPRQAYTPDVRPRAGAFAQDPPKLTDNEARPYSLTARQGRRRRCRPPPRAGPRDATREGFHATRVSRVAIRGRCERRSRREQPSSRRLALADVEAAPAMLRRGEHHEAAVATGHREVLTSTARGSSPERDRSRDAGLVGQRTGGSRRRPREERLEGLSSANVGPRQRGGEQAVSRPILPAPTTSSVCPREPGPA